jgi:hypothetical protein
MTLERSIIKSKTCKSFSMTKINTPMETRRLSRLSRLALAFEVSGRCNSLSASINKDLPGQSRTFQDVVTRSEHLLQDNDNFEDFLVPNRSSKFVVKIAYIQKHCNKLLLSLVLKESCLVHSTIDGEKKNPYSQLLKFLSIGI